LRFIGVEAEIEKYTFRKSKNSKEEKTLLNLTQVSSALLVHTTTKAELSHTANPHPPHWGGIFAEKNS
jgi:hypothetical protein